MQQPTFYPIQLKTGEVIELARVSHVLSEINKMEFVGKRLFYGNGSRAAIGTKADEIICRIINGTKFSRGAAKEEWLALDEKVKNAVRAYIRWQQATGFKPRFTHMIVYSLKYGIAGELDFGGLIKNCMVIVEAKTGELHPDLHLMQLVVYMVCYLEMYPKKRLTEIRLVRFNMDTGNFTDIPLTKEKANEIFQKFLQYKNRILEWDGNYKHRHMMTNQKNLQEAVMVSQSKAIQPYQRTPVLSKEKATELIRSLWPEAPALEVAKAVWLCVTYGLDPLRKHVALVPFKNKKTGTKDWVAILEIQADRDIAAQGGAYGYIDDTPRIMTEAEEIKLNGRVQPDKWCAITKLKYGNNIVMGDGYWPKSEEPYGVEKGNTGLNMAEIRSERKALRRLPNKAQLPPSDIEVMDGDYIEIPKIISGEVIPPESITEPSEAPPECVGEATEGREDLTRDNPPALLLGGKYGDMLTTCWQHGEDWVKDPKKAQYGYWHSDKDGFCKIKDRLNEVKERLLSKTGTDGSDLNELTKTMFEGKPWSKLTQEQQIQVLDAYYEGHLEAFQKLEQAKMPEA